MAWTSLNTLGSNQNKTAGTSIVLTTSAAAEAGNVVVVIVAIDNTQTTDGNTSEVNSITDSAGGNTWTKAREFCNGQGGAASGATVSVWYSKLTNAIASGGTITANLANSITAKAISAWEFSIAAGATISVAGTPQDLANDNADPGSMTMGGLSSREYLFIRGIAAETNSTTALTPTANFTAFSGNQTSGSGAASNMAVRGEFRILTGTTATSDPSYTAVDSASVFFALRESATLALDGDAVSSSSGQGSLGRIHKTDGAAISNSSAVGNLGRTHKTDGSANSTSSGVGSLLLNRVLGGSTLGQSSAVGGIAKTSGLGGAAVSDSSGTAALALTIQAVGIALGASSAVGTVALLKPLAGNSIASSSVAGDLFAKKVLAGSTLGQSSAVGTAIKTSGVTGTVFSTSSLVGNLLAQYKLAGATVATSSAVGPLTKTGAMSGIAAGTSLGTAALALWHALAGEAVGISSCTGEFISSAIQLQGVANSTSSTVGALLKVSAFDGASVGVAAGVGNLAQAFRLTGRASGESFGTASLTRIFQLAGSAVGASSGTAALAVFWQLTRTTVGASSAIGTLSIVGPSAIVHDLMGTAISLGMTTGMLSLIRPLDGVSRGNASLQFYWAAIPRSRSVGVR